MSTSPHPVAAVCQLTATPDKQANLSTCKQLVEEAKERGASMVFLPEGFDYIGSSREETLSLSESLTGDTISQYTQLARYTNTDPLSGLVWGVNFLFFPQTLYVSKQKVVVHVIKKIQGRRGFWFLLFHLFLRPNVPLASRLITP